MPVPRIAIVGRPNVGKSSLLNLIAQERIAIVEDTPGVTRDRVSVLVDLGSPHNDLPPKTVELTDTGGFGVYAAEHERYDDVGEDLHRLTKDIESQIAEAVSSADVILFAVDVQAGITPQDEQIARLLREQKLGTRQRHAETGEDYTVPVHVVGTKADGPKWEPHAYELAALGFGEPMFCSAKSKYFRRDMLDRLYEITPEATGEPEPEVELKLAIIGKRNAGKSSLINALAGQQRVIVSEIAGTTRDAVDVRFELDGRSILAIDTAGLRKKKSFSGPIEWYAFDRAKRSIQRADVVLLLLDAVSEISQVDEQLAQLSVDSYKPVIIVVNKWDLTEGRSNRKGQPLTPGDYEEYVRKELKGLSFAPISVVSSTRGTNLRATIKLAFELHQQASQRVTTSGVNKFIEGVLSTRGPSNKLGSVAKVFYATQIRTCPPTIVMVVNRPEMFTPAYMRFFENRMREELPFAEVPIRIIVRGRSREEKKRAWDEQRTTRVRRAPDGGLGLAAVDPKDLAELRAMGIDPEALLTELPEDAESYFED